MSPRPLVYTRPLPGGGYVAIDCDSHEGDHHARLWVERRADTGRRAGHAPPVIAEAHDGDPVVAVERLRGIAADNVSLAAALRRWQTNRS
jgi:hypothetical protein